LAIGIPPLSFGNEGAEEEHRNGMGGLEDVTAEEVEAEFDQLQLRLSDLQVASWKPPSYRKLREV